MFSDNRWCDISGNNAPYVDYRVVEVIESINTVRFGTYGRGIWDFVLKEETLADCNGTPEGTAYLDYCNECVGGTTGEQPCQVPYATHYIPGTVELEAFDYGGEGVSYHDATVANEGGQLRLDEGVDISTVNSGGYYLGWSSVGDWTEYTVIVDESGAYDIDYITASPNSNGLFHLEMDNEPITESVSVATTGAWQQWQTRSISNIALTAGTHVLKFYIEGGSFDMDKLIFKKAVVTSLSKETFKRQILIYPNPVKGEELTISIPQAAKARIIDNNGKEKYQLTIENKTSLRISDWKPGVYFIEFLFAGKKVVEKVVVQ